MNDLPHAQTFVMCGHNDAIVHIHCPLHLSLYNNTYPLSIKSMRVFLCNVELTLRLPLLHALPVGLYKDIKQSDIHNVSKIDK